jgi:hypothetical protein
MQNTCRSFSIIVEDSGMSLLRGHLIARLERPEKV